MKLIPDELCKTLADILADAVQKTVPNGIVFNALQQLLTLKDAPKEELK